MAENFEKFKKVLQDSSEEMEKLIAAYQRLEAAMQRSESLKSASDVLEVILSQSNEITALWAKLNTFIEKNKDAEKDFQNELQVIQKAMGVVNTQADKTLALLHGTTEEAIESEKSVLAMAVALLQSQNAADRLKGAQLISAAATKKAQENTDKIYTSMVQVVKTATSLESILASGANFAAKIATYLLVRAGTVSGLTKIIEDKITQKGAQAVTTAAQAASGAITKSATTASTGLTALGTSAAASAATLIAAIAGNPVVLTFAAIGAAIIAAIGGIAWTKLKTAADRMTGAMNMAASNISVGASGIVAAGYSYLDNVAKVQRAFLANADESKRFLNAMYNAIPAFNLVEGASTRLAIGLEDMRAIQVSTNQRMEDLTSNYSRLFYLTGRSGTSIEKLNRVNTLYYEAVARGAALSREGIMSMPTFLDAWKQASDSATGIRQNQLWLIDATAKAARALESMGRDVREAGSVISSMVRGFADVDDAIKILSMPGRGLAAISEWYTLSPEEMRNRIMTSPVGTVIQSMAAYGAAPFAIRGLGIMQDMSSIVAAYRAGLFTPGRVISQAEEGRILTKNTKDAIDQVAGNIKELSIAMESKLSEISNAIGKIGTNISAAQSFDGSFYVTNK